MYIYNSTKLNKNIIQHSLCTVSLSSYGKAYIRPISRVMSSPRIDFISGSAEHSPDKSERDLSLRYACPVIDSDRETSGVLRRERREPMRDARSGDSSFAEDGLYVPENPFTDRIVKPYRLDDARPLDYATTRPRLRGRLVEIAIRDVRVRDASQEQAAAPTLEIAAVTVLFKRRPVCKTRAPFNRELYRSVNFANRERG